LGDAGEAREAYEEALGIARQLAGAAPGDAGAQRDLIATCFRVGSLAQRTFEFAEAAGWYEKALQVARRFSRPGVFAAQVRDLEGRPRFCQAAARAMNDPTAALKEPAALRLGVLRTVMEALARRKDHLRAATAADLLASQGKDDPGTLYDA